MQTFVLISGFARSGKSTLQSQLTLNGIPSASSSDTLAEETLRHFQIPVTDANLEILRDKLEIPFQELVIAFTPKKVIDDCLSALRNTEVFKTELEGFNLIFCPRFNTRNAKIYVAEYLIVPTYGRQFFCESCLTSLGEQQESPLKVVFTTIRSEQDDLLDILALRPDTKVLLCNLRRKTELTNVDSRHLFTSFDFELQNDDITPEELYTECIDSIERITNGNSKKQC